MFDSRRPMQPKCRILDGLREAMRDQGTRMRCLVSGELGVLPHGHARNACWYGSRLPIEETRFLALYQNATGIRYRLTATNWTSRRYLETLMSLSRSSQGPLYRLHTPERKPRPLLSEDSDRDDRRSLAVPRRSGAVT